MKHWLVNGLIGGLIVVLAALLLMGSAQAQQGKRMALLIGNNNYQHERTLKNPVNDVNLLAKVFRDDLRFDTVVSEPNLTMANMSKVIDAFVKAAEGKQIESVVFYFSGHGMMAENRENFLLPVDAQLGNDGPLALRAKAVSASLLQEQLEKLGAKITLLILDACRDGPGKGKSGVKGLAVVGGGDEVLVAYATKANAIAEDGDGLYSPYAEALAVALRQVNVPILKQLDEVSDAVRKKYPRQKPTRYGNLRTDAYLVAGAVTSNAALPAPVQVAATSNPAPLNQAPKCDYCPEMVAIPGGQFQMGSNDYDDEKPVRTVKVGAFMMGKYEVTQGQWKAVMGSNPSSFNACGDNCPVENVSWNDAQAYIAKLSAKTGSKYRLPSEAEWEYAARAGSSGKWSFGDNEKELGKYAWYGAYQKDGNSGSKTHPVGEKLKNPFGLHDMHGNVWEWVEDCYHVNYNNAPLDGIAWSKDCQENIRRVLRGGSWGFNPTLLRSANRVHVAPEDRNYGTGLRVAWTPP